MTIETTIGRISAKIPGLGESSYEIIAITKNLPTDDRRFYTPGDPQVSLRVEARSQDGPNVLIFRGWVKDGAAAERIAREWAGKFATWAFTVELEGADGDLLPAFQPGRVPVPQMTEAEGREYLASIGALGAIS